MRSHVLVVILLALAAPAPAADDGTVAPVPSDVATRQAEALTGKADLLAVKQDWEAAELLYREAIALASDSPDAWYGLGNVDMMQQRFSDALPAFEEALRLRPNDPRALERLGEAYVALGRPDEAQATLERLRPLDAPLAATLAYVIRTGKGRW
jgi:tetratricopeptide (TPR) repeat protein